MTIDGMALRQSFEFDEGKVVREIAFGHATMRQTVVNSFATADPRKAFYVSRLSSKIEFDQSTEGRLTYIDLFCGGGGLSLGVHEALSALGFSPKLVCAADLDNAALGLVVRHFSPLIARCKSVDEMIEFLIDYSSDVIGFLGAPRILDQELELYRGKVDLLIGGPPCQGHSNLNNKTRRNDPRNLLYFTMPAMAVALDIPNVIIENVPSILHSKENVVGITREIFAKHGYKTDEIVLNAADHGVAQSRQRHFLVASKGHIHPLAHCASVMKGNPISFQDVAMNLPPLGYVMPLLEHNGQLSDENLVRVDFLHDNDEFNLPNEERPDCHKTSHTYPSVYGRIFPDQPMQTVTTGFASPGRGRYVHPTLRRTVTCREAGRVQAFPDWYWEKAKDMELHRNDLNKIIGDAVPSVMVEPIVIALRDALKG